MKIVNERRTAMKNSQLLKACLERQHIPYSERVFSDGSLGFSIRNQIKSGDVITLLLAFTLDEETLDVVIPGFIQFDNPLKREKILILLNKFNRNYRYYKFYIEDDGLISMQCSLPIFNFYPEGAVRIAFSMLTVFNDEYQKITDLYQS